MKEKSVFTPSLNGAQILCHFPFRGSGVKNGGNQNRISLDWTHSIQS